jgi:hypothetical protein
MSAEPILCLFSAIYRWSSLHRELHNEFSQQSLLGRGKPSSYWVTLDTVKRSALMFKQALLMIFGMPSCFATRENKKQLSIFLRKWSAHTTSCPVSYRNACGLCMMVVHISVLQFQNLWARTYPVQWRAQGWPYSIVCITAWFKSNWLSSVRVESLYFIQL